jgi:hypothetical protein
LIFSGFSFIFEMIFNRFNPPREPVKTNQNSLFASGSFAMRSKKYSNLSLKGIGN